jgi:TRAP-type C4-dicarboxylate transport system substrate-binding protein
MFGIDVVPFLAASYDEARKLWAASKPAIERKFAAQGLMVLFAVPWPPQGIYAKKEINTVADMQGLSWRVYNAGTERIAQIVGAYPVTIQAADLQQALATGLINAFMTSVATGYDSKAWETMSYFYDTQAWLPKNVTLVNKAAFDRLDKTTQEVLLKAAASAEARGWSTSQDRHRWYGEQLAAHGLKVLPPSDALKSGLPVGFGADRFDHDLVVHAFRSAHRTAHRPPIACQCGHDMTTDETAPTRHQHALIASHQCFAF